MKRERDHDRHIKFIFISYFVSNNLLAIFMNTFLHMFKRTTYVCFSFAAHSVLCALSLAMTVNCE